VNESEDGDCPPKVTLVTSQERRGQRLFLVLASLIILDKLAAVGFALAGGMANVHWLKSVVAPIGFALAVAFLWQGENWLRWLVGVACILSGGALAFVSGRLLIRFAGVTPPDATGFFMQIAGYPLGIVGLIGLFYLIAGLLFLFSPSLQAFFRYQREGAPGKLFEIVDALNAEAGGGEPTATERVLGRLEVRSGALVICDPQYLPGLEIPNIAAAEVIISARLWRYPSGAETVTALTLRFNDSANFGSLRKIGEVGIDSAKLVVADKADLQEHWCETGTDRIGVISTGSGDTVLRLLTKRFNLKTVRVNPVRAEVVHPVSKELAKEIEDYLKSIPKYADYPFIYFHVQTNNSLDRANYMGKVWEFMPIGDRHGPLMFVCGTGRGDGIYDVKCGYLDDVPQIVSITFIDDAEE
jgi:hypothetical protein